MNGTTITDFSGRDCGSSISRTTLQQRRLSKHSRCSQRGQAIANINFAVNHDVCHLSELPLHQNVVSRLKDTKRKLLTKLHQKCFIARCKERERSQALRIQRRYKLELDGTTGLETAASVGCSNVQNHYLRATFKEGSAVKPRSSLSLATCGNAVYRLNTKGQRKNAAGASHCRENITRIEVAGASTADSDDVAVSHHPHDGSQASHRRHRRVPVEHALAVCSFSVCHAFVNVLHQDVQLSL